MNSTNDELGYDKIPVKMTPNREFEHSTEFQTLAMVLIIGGVFSFVATTLFYNFEQDTVAHFVEGVWSVAMLVCILKCIKKYHKIQKSKQ